MPSTLLVFYYELADTQILLTCGTLAPYLLVGGEILLHYTRVYNERSNSLQTMQWMYVPRAINHRKGWLIQTVQLHSSHNFASACYQRTKLRLLQETAKSGVAISLK